MNTSTTLTGVSDTSSMSSAIPNTSSAISDMSGELFEIAHHKKSAAKAEKQRRKEEQKTIPDLAKLKQFTEKADCALKDARILFTKVYDAWAITALGLAKAIYNKNELVKDIRQMVWIEIWEKPPKRITTAYLGQLIKWRGIDHIRKNPPPFDSENLQRKLKSSEPSPQENLERKILREAIDDAVEQLPEVYRTAFQMHVLWGHSHKEIAECLGIKESTSRTRVSEGRKIVQSSLEKKELKP